MSTALARSLQPASVPHEDAIFNVSRSTLLIAALIQSPELLLVATEDRLHQSYRASAMPETDRLIRLLRAAGTPPSSREPARPSSSCQRIRPSG